MENKESEISKIIKETLEQFLSEFIEKPYLCYTEHGLHALYFAQLYKALGDKCYTELDAKPICIIQKEYPTNDKFEKSRRQNWDIAVIDSSGIKNEIKYDYLPLEAIIEFGLNASICHLCDDFLRISHPKSNSESGYVVHLYRLNKKFSDRDISENAKDIKNDNEFKRIRNLMLEMSKGELSCDNVSQCKKIPEKRLKSEKINLTLYLGVANVRKNGHSRLWRFFNGNEEQIQCS